MMGLETETTGLSVTTSLGANRLRIYVACLASYNNGCLFDRWIDALDDEAALRAEVSAMLLTSPEPDSEE